MAKRKPQPEPFDVAEFLRPTDTDLRSALTSLLGEAGGGAKLGPGAKEVGAPDVSDIEAETNLAGGAELGEALPDPMLGGARGFGERAGPDTSLQGGINLGPGLPFPVEASPAPAAPLLRPGLNLRRDKPPSTFPASPESISDPGPNLTTPSSPKPRTFAIREAKLAQDGHTRVEQFLYETLWERAKPHDDISRLITIGFAGMARLVRLSESNARINLRSLIQKLAIEEYSTYNCEQSLGRTYRVFNYGEILRRRREAGLVWYMRKTLAVLFVDPNTGQPLISKPKPQRRDPGLNLTGQPDLNSTGEAGLILGTEPGLNLPGLNREFRVEHLSRELAASAPVLYEHLSQYGHADDDAIRRLFLACRRQCPDCTVDEIGYFIHQKASVASRMPLHNVIGFLITAVPKCFAGEAFQSFRSEQRRKQQQLEEQRRREEAELAQWRAEQKAMLEDPAVPEEEKAWIRKILQ